MLVGLGGTRAKNLVSQVVADATSNCANTRFSSTYSCSVYWAAQHRSLCIAPNHSRLSTLSARAMKALHLDLWRMFWMRWHSDNMVGVYSCYRDYANRPPRSARGLTPVGHERGSTLRRKFITMTSTDNQRGFSKAMAKFVVVKRSYGRQNAALATARL